MTSSLQPNTTPPVVIPAITTGSVTPQVVLSDRVGSFVVPDIYPGDLGHNPPFKVLPGLHFSGGKEVVGAVIKAAEGTGWGAANEEWFRHNWREIKNVGGSRYGNDWFRGCYSFLRFSADGAKQADYFCDLVDSAGGWGNGDLMPWADVEAGGQGSWAPGEDLSKLSSADKKRLAADVTRVTSAFVSRFKKRTGLRIAVYGRGIFRDLSMASCMFGADAIVNPAYTYAMPKMNQYGVPLDKIIFWQLAGDGSVAAKGFEPMIPGWGKTDYSAFLDGANIPSLSAFRRRCLARVP